MVHLTASITRVLPAAVMGLAVAAAGCQAFQSKQSSNDGKSSPAVADAKPSKPGIPVTEIAASWNRKIELGTNPTDHTPMPAIMGRITFIHADTPESKAVTVEADGKLTIELYDDTNRRADKPCERLGTWNIAAEHLAKMESKDVIGTGYTLTLPWPTYKPEITQIHLAVHYTPRSGQPISVEDQVMTLEASPDLLISHQTTASQTVPAAATR